MSEPVPSLVVSFLAPTLLLGLALLAATRRWRSHREGALWKAGCFLAALALLSLPVDGIPLARYLAGVMDHWSLPLLALILSATVKACCGVELLRREDHRAAWAFGVVMGLVLFPAALGLGPVDTYTWGWREGPLPLALTVISLLLLVGGNRFGIVLVLAAAAWRWGTPESGNYWDTLIDPPYFFASVFMVTSGAIHRFKRGKSLPIEQEQERLV